MSDTAFQSVKSIHITNTLSTAIYPATSVCDSLCVVIMSLYRSLALSLVLAVMFSSFFNYVV